MANKFMEAQFEAQVDELKERLHDCLQSCSPEAMIAREILENLIREYQQQLLELRDQREPSRPPATA